MRLKKRQVMVFLLLLPFFFSLLCLAGLEPSPFKILQNLKLALTANSFDQQKILLQSSLKNLNAEKSPAFVSNKNRAKFHIKAAIKKINNLMKMENQQTEIAQELKDNVHGHIKWAISYVGKMYPGLAPEK